jgi:hypothetical protein
MGGREGGEGGFRSCLMTVIHNPVFTKNDAPMAAPSRFPLARSVVSSRREGYHDS